MRRLLATSVLCFLSGIVLPSCSALGLADLPQANCTVGDAVSHGDPYCASLALRVPPSDDCHTWQCNPLTNHCEQQARDDDGDNTPSLMCAGSATPDCNDMDGHNFPGNLETCNGLDDNCDGVVDDGVIATSVSAGTLGTLSETPDQFELTDQPDADEAFILARSMTFHGVTVSSMATDFPLAFGQIDTGTHVVSIVPQLADAAVAALGSSTYAVVTRRAVTGVCQQWALFPARSGMAAATLRAADESLLPACATGGQQVSAPGIASIDSGATGDTLLVAWLAGASADRSCGSATAMPVTISSAAFDSRPTAHNRVGTDVITLGNSVDNGPPIVLGIGDAFLVAYARADMTIAVHVVTVDPVTLAITASATPTYVEPAGASLRQGVGLALGPTASGATSVALSYYEACGGSNPITVRLLSRAAGAITASSTPATGIGTGIARSQVQLAYQPRSSEWIVGWRSGSGIAVQRLFEDGATEGEPFDVTTSSASAFLVEPLTAMDSPLYRVVSLAGTNVTQSSFGCAAMASP